MLDIKTSNPKL